ncbi:hypothetical protein AYI68_g7011 [Smittium mucronatum]|uniref:Uncharacterized protein n=1 Tax=Smittium mucronatum TaxID=133383 RepID=A0A1R0GP18_9FUNG|nr:hypothetical protein AYI68_g7325 [Smittium mucronatum]OLY78930.1 hypothetical protein AYI68_g7011 [Smittium mucronatum]
MHPRRHMRKMDPVAHVVLTEEVVSLLAKNAIEEISGDTSCPYFGTSNSQEDIRIEELFTVESEVLDFDTPAEFMECAVISARVSRDGSLYWCQRHSLGDNCGLT